MRNLNIKNIRKIIVNCFSKKCICINKRIMNTNYNINLNTFINMNTLFYNQLYPRLKELIKP